MCIFRITCMLFGLYVLFILHVLLVLQVLFVQITCIICNTSIFHITCFSKLFVLLVSQILIVFTHSSHTGDKQETG